MAQLQFTLGENINEILLDIAQNKMKTGDFDGALQTYMQSFEGFPKDLAIGILQESTLSNLSMVDEAST